MKFEDIPFMTRDGPYGLSFGLRMQRRNWVPKRYLDLMHDHALKHLPKFDGSQVLDAEMVFGGRELWQVHQIRGRLALGRSLKYLVDHKILPLREINKGKKGKRKYVLIHPLATEVGRFQAFPSSINSIVAPRTENTHADAATCRESHIKVEWVDSAASGPYPTSNRFFLGKKHGNN